MRTTIITKNKSKLRIADEYTTATLTVRLSDGSHAFSDGLGGYWRRALSMIPGYDFVYADVVASAEHDDAHEAIGSGQPQGSSIVYRDRVPMELLNRKPA